MHNMTRLSRHPLLPLLLALCLLLPVYLSTLQTIPNGAELDYFMIDVGETQIVLNVWGTLHSTGYPLYVILGNLLTTLLRTVGVDALAAAALTSLLWGLLALTVLYALLRTMLRDNAFNGWIAAGVVLLYGLTRTVWIHHVIAEIYTFGLLLLVLLLWLALREPPIRRRLPPRLYLLALVGGVAVFHHRALLMVAPALLFAAWRDLFTVLPGARRWRVILRRCIVCLLLGLLGGVQYGYLLARAQAGAAWVYGEPGTLQGLWDQFIGTEASRFIGTPGTPDALLANFALVNRVLLADLTLPGLLLGLTGLLLALRGARRRAALTLLLSGAAAYLFHVLLYTDVLSQLILPITLSIACGWALLAEQFWRLATIQQNHTFRRVVRVGLPAAGGLLAFVLLTGNHGYISALVRDETGLQTIALARAAPPGSTLMIAWGPRHFAVGIAQQVWGELPEVRLVDHKADYGAAAADGTLVTPEYTFYTRPPGWWRERLGAPVYLTAAAPLLVRVALTPETPAQPPDGFGVLAQEVRCSPDGLVLAVDWFTPAVPAEDLSVFVHALNADGVLIGQGDQRAPVYGWRPLTTWTPGEVVRDVYLVTGLNPADVRSVRYGLYRVGGTADAPTFENIYAYELAVMCDG